MCVLSVFAKTQVLRVWPCIQVFCSLSLGSKIHVWESTFCSSIGEVSENQPGLLSKDDHPPLFTWATQEFQA